MKQFEEARAFMIFFDRMKIGTFGEFYGNVDPIKIGAALGKFMAWRSNELSRIERQKEMRKIEALYNNPRCITYEEYQRDYDLNERNI